MIVETIIVLMLVIIFVLLRKPYAYQDSTRVRILSGFYKGQNSARVAIYMFICTINIYIYIMYIYIYILCIYI